MIVLLGALLGPTPVKAYTSCQTGYTLSGNDCTLSRMRDTDSSGTCSSTTFNQPAWTGNCRAVPYGKSFLFEFGFNKFRVPKNFWFEFC